MRAVLVERLAYGAVGTDVLGLTGPAWRGRAPTPEPQAPRATVRSRRRWPRRAARRPGRTRSVTRS